MNRTNTASLEFKGEFPNEVIRASAGTGKTFELSNRYLRLLASGVECNSILATTFTRKGAGEILDRIMERLSAAALDEAAATELSEQLRWKLTTDRAAEILHDLLKSLHRLEIGTLDGFFNRFAQAFSLELGLPATWEIVENQVIQGLQDQAIERILYEDHVVDLFHMMSHGEAKRRIATEVRDIVKSLYEVYSDATAEAWEKIPRLKGKLDEAALHELLDSMPEVELPDNKNWRKAWDKLVQQLAEEELEKIVSAGLVSKVANGETKYYSKEIPPAVHAIAKTILDHCGAHLTNKLITQNLATRDLLKRFSEEFEPLKSSTGQLRFQDVTTRLAAYIGSISVEGLSFRLDNQVRHLMLDEFQDTSPGQWSVISPFASRVTQTESDDAEHSFFCVGDVKQAIFGWRGGEAEIFDRVESELSNLSDTTPRTKSWRSSPHVINFVNRVFQNLDRYEPGEKYQSVADAVHAWKAWFNEHETARAELDGCATVEFAEPVANDKGKTDAKESLYASTISKIQELNEQLPESKSIGVLVRTRAEIGELIFRLRQLGIPASEEGGNPLTDSAAVEIVLAALKLADSPGDSLARFRLSHSSLGPHFGIEEQDGSNGSACQQQAITASKRIRRELVEHGYGPYLESLARILAPECTVRESNRLQKLVQIAYSTEANGMDWQLRPGRFVNFIREDYKAVEPSSARIRVMTIHSSKGLEFDAVVVPLRTGTHATLTGVTPKVVTGRSSPTEPIDLVTRFVNKQTQVVLPNSVQKVFTNQQALVVRESMCLLYVAITRAVHATHVILSPDTKKEAASAAAVVLSTVADGEVDPEENLIVHESGNLNWHEAYSSDQASKDDAAAANQTSEENSLSKFYLPDNASLADSLILGEIRSGRGVANRYPSAKQPIVGNTFGDRFKIRQHSDAANKGSLVHACFELVEWLDQSDPPSDESLTKRLRQIDPNLEITQSAIKVFRHAIEQANTLSLLSHKTQLAKLGGDRLVVMTEYQFAVATDAGLLNGTIDRIVLSMDGDQIVEAEIIDFKTDRVTAETAADRAETYSPQMNAYAEAIALAFNLAAEKIHQTIVFAEIDHLVEITLESNGESKGKPKPKVPKRKADKPGKRSKPKSDPDGESQQTLW